MLIRWAYLKRVLAGAVFGLYMAHLLFFLNPQVDITPWRLAVVTVVYGLICGFLFGTLLWALHALRVKVFGKRETEGYRAHGFGFVPLAAFIAAAIYWIHLTAVRIAPGSGGYLPINAIRILSKATNLITVVAFLLLLLWFFERNADRRTSRAIFVTGVFAIAVSSFSLYARRDSYRTEKNSVVVANVGTVAGERPVIVVAIRNLPYDWLVTIAGEGNLPFFAEAQQHSFVTRLEPFPTSSPDSLWASLATGKLPYRHGVTGRYSYRTPLNGSDPTDRFLLLPSGVGFEALGRIPPVRRISAQLPAGDALPFWAIFERLSISTAVVNWPMSGRTTASHVVSDAAIRAAPRSSAGVANQRFNSTGRARGRILYGLACDTTALGALRSAASRQAFGLEVVALDGFSEAQRALHVWSNQLPPRTSEKGEGVRAYVEQLDRALGDLARDFPGHLLVVVSPSGPEPPGLPDTPYFVAREMIAAEDPGADDGFVLISGSGTTRRENASPAYTVDIVPTVLFAAGLPAARDMDGRVLTDAFDDDFLRRNPLSMIGTYEAGEIVVRRAGDL